MIEIIKGYTSEFEELEELANDFIIRNDGRLIDTFTETTQVTENGNLKQTLAVYFVIEYDNPIENWQAIYNTLARNALDRENILWAFFKTENPFISDETVKPIVDYYEEHNILADLAELHHIEYKEDDIDDNETL
ncbi:hypothetical protein NW133_07235 [Staphylococcus pettenkoferi]|uniref:Uncharacterized protein n=1 Tax=Staphylococcus pettenkoferi TaxID=170573 RepID=A0ABT4BKW8_9STAP|nr:hypothetical protein [Staphylococcus pettenkoferi]MCY1583320.1 hypothetical protein [Staphylococcus pettenkoferi]